MVSFEGHIVFFNKLRMMINLVILMNSTCLDAASEPEDSNTQED